MKKLILLSALFFLCACETPVKTYEPQKVIEHQPKATILETKKEDIKVINEVKKKVLHEVTRIVDGDTIEINYFGEPTKLRLFGLDTPETKHPNKPVECYGHEASKNAKYLLLGEKVEVETDGKRGYYGRLLAYIKLNGDDYGEIMIRGGFGKHLRKYPHTKISRYNEAEEEAQKFKRGMWNSKNCNYSK